MYIIIRNIIRHKSKSCITVLICIFLVAAINIYLGNMRSNREQLRDLPQVMPVFCQITNLNGSQSAGIWIDETLSKRLIASRHVKDAAYGVRMMGGIGDFPTEEWEQKLTMFVEAVNSIASVPGLTRESIKSDVRVDDFFQSSDPQCIVSSTLMEKNKWEEGQEIPLNLYYYDYNEEGIYCHPLEVLNVTVVGEMDGASEDGFVELPDILLPVGYMETIFERSHIPMNLSYFSFYVSDPLALNDFKEEMKSFGLMEKNAMADDSYEGCALTVKDTVFVSMADKLRKTIQIFEGFFSIICITIAGISYIVSTLLTESRAKEFALMRAMGATAAKCIAIFWCEQLCLAGLGFVIADAVCLPFQTVNTVLLSDAVIAATYMTGCMAALLHLGKRSAMQLLFAAE